MTPCMLMNLVSFYLANTYDGIKFVTQKKWLYTTRLMVLMVRWVVRSILMEDPLTFFSFQPMLHNWCNKGQGMCYSVSRMVPIKEPLLLIAKSRPCSGGGSRFSLAEGAGRSSEVERSLMVRWVVGSWTH